MISIIVVIFLNWLLLKFVFKHPTSVLGITPNGQRLKELSLGITYMAIIGLINFFWQAEAREISYSVNREYSFWAFLSGSFWVFRAVLFEELLFRGVLLFLLIKYVGIVKACLISSIIFGMYHWFSYEVFGERIILMAYIFLITGAGGWMFAYAYAKTRSLYLPVGLHFGWNFVAAVIFSSGPIGNQLLIQQGDPVKWNEWYTLIFFALQALVAPGIVTWYLAKVYKKPT